MRVFADFDGTIAIPDVTDLILSRFAAPEWEDIEGRWIGGEIDAAACMRQQIVLIEAQPSALNTVLDQVEIDPDFPAFARWCAEAEIPLAIVSDGVDHFIRRILARYDLGDIPVFANELRSYGPRHELNQPWRNDKCAARQGVCKCAVTRADAGPVIFVGDGRSDQCVSQIADMVFAKGRLAEFCARTNRDFTPFITFADVHDGLSLLRRRNNPRDAAIAD